MLNALKKTPAMPADPELTEIERQDAELRELEAEFFKRRNAYGVADSQRKAQQLFVERLRSDGQALLGVTEEEFTAHERTLRELLRSEAKAKNELQVFVESHPDLDRQRAELTSRRMNYERDEDVRRLGTHYFEVVQPAVAAAYKLLTDHQRAKDELSQKYPRLTILAMGIPVQQSPFSRTLDCADVDAYLQFERLFHRREQLDSDSSARAASMLREAETEGAHKVTRPKWVW